MESKKRKSAEICLKLEIIEDFNNKATPTELPRKYGLAALTISTIVKNQEATKKASESMRDIKKAKRLREPEYKELKKYLDISTSKQIDVLDAIYKLKTAWDSVAPSTISACFRKGGFKKSSNLDIIESIDNNQLDVDKIVNFDKYAFRHCDDLVVSGETYSNDLVSLEQGEQTEEAEPSLTIETETEFISKEKAIAGLNTAREYFMNSKED
ncbi:tigger transposable element-derived 6-like [Brachionus plicatilis]|uniref:Tigger transposable element-derived 6-like n=1 Tax=Brachionus plicatilis TaxID=10195 RepID=A0A3M7PIP1_BRAPC|nr:tigger transposable element-derived 6-like [Brachionus plicatilis]